jgi:hypothetical protein
MTTTRTPGITVLADGRRLIDKRYLGVRIGLRVGAVAQERAEERLRTEMKSESSRPNMRKPPFWMLVAKRWRGAVRSGSLSDYFPQPCDLAAFAGRRPPSTRVECFLVQNGPVEVLDLNSEGAGFAIDLRETIVLPTFGRRHVDAASR